MTSKSRSPGYVRKWLISTQGAETPVGGQTIFVGNAICVFIYVNFYHATDVGTGVVFLDPVGSLVSTLWVVVVGCCWSHFF